MNKDFWNTVFEKRNKEFSYEPILNEIVPYLSRNELLDIGCGDGKNSFYFAQNGFNVNWFDFSKSGLNKIKEKADKLSFQFSFIEADINKWDFQSYFKKFNSIALIHFFPDFEVFHNIFDLLQNGGTLFCKTFINDYFDKESPRYSVGISTNEISEIENTKNIIFSKKHSDDRGKFVSFLIKS